MGFKKIATKKEERIELNGQNDSLSHIFWVKVHHFRFYGLVLGMSHICNT